MPKDGTVRPGEEIVVRVRKQGRGREAERPAGPRPAEQPARARGFAGGDDASPIYVRRRKTFAAVRFYDLGTRLRSVAADTVFEGTRERGYLSEDTAAPDESEGRVHEYVEIDYEAAGEVVTGSWSFTPWGSGDVTSSAGETHFLDVPDESWQRLDNVLLGSRADFDGNTDSLDPFGFTTVNGGSRLVPNCMEITRPQLADSSYAALRGQVITPQNFQPSPNTYENFFLPRQYNAFDAIEASRFVLRDLARDEWPARDDEEAGERWSPVTRAAGAVNDLIGYADDFFTNRKGRLIYGDLIPDQARDSDGNPTSEDHARWIGPAPDDYLSFDTGDTTNFKVTNLPRFDAPAVRYNFKGEDNRVYLRPTPAGWVTGEMQSIPDGTRLAVASAWIGRSMPVLPLGGYDTGAGFAPFPFPALDCYVGRVAHYAGGSVASTIDIIHPQDARRATTTLSYGDNTFHAPFPFERMRALFVPKGRLCAAIGQGPRVFYVWANTDHLHTTIHSIGRFTFGVYLIGECSP